MTGITESVVEEACLGWFRALGFVTAFGPDIGPDGNSEERSSWEDVLLVNRLRTAVATINPAACCLAHVPRWLRRSSQVEPTTHVRLRGGWCPTFARAPAGERDPIADEPGQVSGSGSPDVEAGVLLGSGELNLDARHPLLSW